MDHLSDMLKLIISDVDGTLADSRQPIDKEIASLITNILQTKLFCAISGGDKDLLCKQFQPLFDRKKFLEKNFFLSATSGTALYRIEKNEPCCVYKEELIPKEKKKIQNIIHALANEFFLIPATKDSGPLIEDRRSQITLSCIGHQAPVEMKEKWDPKGKKRADMISWIFDKHKKQSLDVTGLNIRIGGTTSIDFTRYGLDKKKGIKRLLSYLNMDKKQAIFFGDKTHKQGNDYIDNYVKTIQVKSVSDMKENLKRLL